MSGPTSHMSVELFRNKDHDLPLTEYQIEEYTSRYFLACMQNLDLLENASTTYTKEEWQCLLVANYVVSTTVSRDYADAIMPKSGMTVVDPEVAIVTEGVTVTGSRPVRFDLKDIIKERFSLESRIDITVSDIFAGFDVTKVQATLDRLKIKYDFILVQKVIGYLMKISDHFTNQLSQREFGKRLIETLGVGNFDIEAYSRALLEEPEHYLKKTRFKTTPNLALFPVDIIPPLVPYGTLKTLSTQTGVMSFNPITGETVEFGSPNVEIKRIVSGSGYAMDILPYPTPADYDNRFIMVGEVVYVGNAHDGRHAYPTKFESNMNEIKVFAVPPDAHVKYNANMALDKCWLLFDINGNGKPSKYVKAAVADIHNPRGHASHPYFNGNLDLGDPQATAMRMETSVPRSHSEAASVFPFVRIEQRDDGMFTTKVAKYLGDASLKAIPRSHFAAVANQIVSALGGDIQKDVSNFVLLDAEIFEASQSQTVPDDDANAIGDSFIDDNGKYTFDGLAGIAGAANLSLPPGAGPYEYLVELASHKDVYTEGNYGQKAAEALVLLRKIFSAISQYVGHSHAFDQSRVPPFSATKNSIVTIYYALSKNVWKFRTRSDNNQVQYYGEQADSRADALVNRAGFIFEAGALAAADNNPGVFLNGANALFAMHPKSQTRQKRGRPEAEVDDDMDTTEGSSKVTIASMTKKSGGAKKTGKGKSKKKKVSEGVEEEHTFVDARPKTKTPVIINAAARGGDVPIELTLRLLTLDEIREDLVGALMFALYLIDFDYAGVKKLTSRGICPPFALGICSRFLVKTRKTMFMRRSAKGLQAGGGITQVVLEPHADVMKYATDNYETKMKHTCVLTVATDSTGFDSHIVEYYSGRNRLICGTAEAYTGQRPGETEADAMVIPVFAGECPGTEHVMEPFILADPLDDNTPTVTNPNQKRYAALLIKHLDNKGTIANFNAVFSTPEEALGHQPAFWVDGAYFVNDKSLLKDVFHKGHIVSNQRAHVPGAKQGYFGKTVLGEYPIPAVDQV